MGREDFVGEGEGVDMIEVGGEEGGKGRRRRSEGGLGNEETEHVRGCFFSRERCGYMRCTRSSPSPSDPHSYYRRRARGSRLEGSCSSLPPFPILSFFFSLLLQHPTTLSLSYLFLFSTIFSVPRPPTNIPTLHPSTSSLLLSLPWRRIVQPNPLLRSLSQDRRKKRLTFLGVYPFLRRSSLKRGWIRRGKARAIGEGAEGRERVGVEEDVFARVVFFRGTRRKGVKHSLFFRLFLLCFLRGTSSSRGSV